MRKIIFVIVFLGNALLFGQTGSIKVKVLDKANKEEIPFANVILESKGKQQIAVGTSNIDGECVFNSLAAGIYSVKCSYVGYTSFELNKIHVDIGKTIIVKIEMQAATSLQMLEIVTYSEPLIDPDTKSGSTVTREEYQHMATKNINSVSAISAGVYQSDGGGRLNIRGQRSDGVTYYIDGVKVIGNANVDNEEYKKASENEFKNVRNNPFSTFSIDVDAASYSNVRRFVNGGMLPPKDAVRIEEMVNYFSYNYPQPKENKPFSINTEATVGFT